MTVVSTLENNKNDGEKEDKEEEIGTQNSNNRNVIVDKANFQMKD